MAFDGIFLSSVVKQLQKVVTTRITKIYQISDTEILLVCKGHYNCQLIISAHSSYNRIHVTDRQYPTRTTPSNFIMVLRKHIEGGVITSIKQVDLDRYLIITVSSRNELGDRVSLDLYVELMGKYANVILVHNDRIIDALKHIPPFENTIRTIQPGAKFTVTAPQANKVNPFEINDIANRENLFMQLTGFSPLLADEVVYRLNNNQSYTSIMDTISNSDKMYITKVKNDELFHCIPLTHLSDNYEEYGICEGLDYLYFSKEERERIRQITGDLFKFTRREINKFTKKIDTLMASLEQALDCDKYRLWGDLIFANLDKIQKGFKSITVEDWDGNPITIPLDEKLDSKGNGKKMFTKYHKLSVGQKYINEQIDIATENLQYFQLIQSQLEMADFKTASEIRTELENHGYLKKKAVKGKPKKQVEPNYTKLSIEDKTILIGKNNIQNDFITFKKASRYDYWFHVKDSSGSHLVINSDNPTEDEIRLCAMLAAYHSKLRDSSSIPVNYTLIKNLKKIPDSKLGKVIMKEYKTIYIDIDKKLLSNYIEV